MEENIIIATEMLVVGLSTVFIVLSAFAFVIWFLKKVDSRLLNNEAASAVKVTDSLFIEKQSDSELVAVISAAATAIIGAKVKVRKIHFLDHQPDEANWTNTGRLNIMGSHNINIKGN